LCGFAKIDSASVTFSSGRRLSFEPDGRRNEMMNALSMTLPVDLPAHVLVGADVRSARDGDRLAFERLVDRTKQMVVAVALGVVRDVRASEDIAQEAYVQAWRDLGSLKNPDSFLPWMRQLTRNKAMSWVRSNRRFAKRHSAWEHEAVEVVASSEPNIVDRAIANEEHAVLVEALEAIPDDAREVLALFYREERSVRQVADLLELSEAAVKKRLERARAALRAELFERFELAARKTAPTAAFTASVIAAITIATPGTAAAATAAAGTAAAKVGGVAASAIVGPMIGFLGAAIGPWLGMKRRIDTAIDETERRALVRYRNKTTALTLGFTTAITTVGASLANHSIPRGVALVLLLPVAVGVTAYSVWMSRVELPAILERRETMAREKDPAAYAAKKEQDTLRQRIAMALVVAVAAVGAAYAVVTVLTQN
jgi:RNA polymerase sigma factor (sigma-70 family)